mmetsp:Transcript_11961/g.32382  ORF Transcript_11961/g.32382 Transcript_11961/m.32382 type:complete len:160 (-) Transcript_11961:3349-3828(-)
MDDVEDPRWLEFKSWWTEKGTKRHIDIKFDRLSGQSEVVIDSAAPVLNSTSKYNQLSESMLEVIEPTMLTTSVDIFAPHGEKARAFDFFVGARFKVLGRNVTLMQCGRKTGVWLNSIAARIAAIRVRSERTISTAFVILRTSSSSHAVFQRQRISHLLT